MNRIGILVGRFQPLHDEHLKLITKALNKFDKLIIVIGSSYQARTLKNPFLAYERHGMIKRSLPENNDRVFFVHQADHPENNDLWVKEIEYKIENLILQDTFGDNPEFFITGHKKDESSFYIDILPWPFVPLGDFRTLNATDIRNSYFGGEPITNWGKDLTLPVIEFLVNFKKSIAFEILSMEYKTNATTKTNS